MRISPCSPRKSVDHNTNRITSICLSLSFGLAVLSGCATNQDNQQEAPSQLPKLETNLRLGKIALKNNDPQTAESIYRKATEMDSRDPRPWIGLGNTALKVQDTDAAIDLFSKAITADAQLAAGHTGLGQALLRAGRTTSAVKSFTAAAKLPDVTAAAFNGWGVGLDALGQHTDAQQAYDQGLKKFPKALSLHNNRAFSLAISGKVDEAIEALTPFAETPTAPHQIKLNLALLHGLAGNVGQAKSWARQVLTAKETQKNLDFYESLRALSPTARAQIILDLATD